RNAATTLAIMGSISITMFLGISWLAAHTHVRYEEGDARSVVAQIAHAVFGGGPMFYLVQIMTAAILFLAANTAFAGFPQLSSVLARDRFLPRQLMNRGDRLVYSNGIIILSMLAALLIVVFNADLNRLIQLYLVGVFTSFTLSQAGMVVHWRRFRERGWQRSLFINAIGAVTTAVVLVVVVVTKFLDGAWIVVSAIPVVIYMMHSVHRHYRQVAEQLGAPERVPVDRRAGQQHMVILVTTVDAAVARAVGYVRAVRPAEVVAIATEPASGPAWGRLAPDIPLEILPQSRSRTTAVRNFLKARRDNLEPDTFLTLVVPEVLKRKGLLEILLHPRLHRLKAAFLSLRNVQVLDVPVLREAIDPRVDLAHEPARNIAVVLVSGVHNAALQAIEYAETLRPTSLRAVSIGLDPNATEKLGNRWLQAGVPHPLEIEDSPFRDIGASLSEYVRQFEADGVERVVTVVIPEFLVRKRRHRILHGQTALIVKRHLLFERGVVVASVPYHLDE
ncbi:MAG TPA: amino acid permease, partial [Actinomycetota bacterium]|nr:amino acid permease [Actinomycetota bacterium]